MTHEELARIASDTIGVPGSVNVQAVEGTDAVSYAVGTASGRMFMGHHAPTRGAAESFGRAAIAWASRPGK